ncbi:dihydroorotate dehydrogenase [Chlamydiota bacterium]
MGIDKTDLSICIGKTLLKNPVTVASGTFGYGKEMSSLYDLNKLGGIFVKSITKEPRRGNPPQRIVETPSGMLNAIGLQNEGIDDFINNKIPFLKQYDTALFVNIAGSTVNDYCYVAERLSGITEVDGIELNLSCPNVKEGCMVFGQDEKMVSVITHKIRALYPKTLIVKLSPNVTDILPYAKAANDAGADGISLVNTFLGMAIDVHSRKPILANITGGLSGPAIRPLALRMVHDVAKELSVPIIGQGGIDDLESALSFFIAGAHCISLGTANFYEPFCAVTIIDQLYDYLEKNSISSIEELVGSLETN